MTEFTAILNKLKDAHKKVQDELANIVKMVPFASSKNRIPKSASFSAEDGLYSPKSSDPYYSVPSTPRV